MSALLGLTSQSQFILPKSPTYKTIQVNFNSPCTQSITGHSVKEIKVTTYQNKELPIKLRIVQKKTIEETKSPKSIKSAVRSPVISPRSLASTRTNLLSPRSGRPADSRKAEVSSPKQKFQYGELSPRQDISELLKKSLKMQSKKHKEMKIKSEKELKTKITKKIQ